MSSMRGYTTISQDFELCCENCAFAFLKLTHEHEVIRNHLVTLRTYLEIRPLARVCTVEKQSGIGGVNID